VSKDFTTQERWDQSYESVRFEVAPVGDPIRDWLEKFIPPVPGSCFELGCFPGRYLAVFGERGYELHGIDRTPRITPDLCEWMRKQGYPVGKFTCGDVFTHPFDRQYEVVCSFGLIEHFGHWPELLQIHARLVKPGGLLIVSTPNFRGLYQRKLHQWLDQANLAEHNLDAMQPGRWAELVRPLGFDVTMCGYIGPYDFWVGSGSRPKWERAILKGLRMLKPLGRCLPDNVGLYAPYCGLVARRKTSA
jgi:L-malate glycosyltransferase